MSDSDSALSLTRQRRDLFVISGLLIVAQLAHFRVNETLTLFGASISVGNPSVLAYGLWVLWAYWLVRYLQFFLREKSAEKIIHALFVRIQLLLVKRAAILFQRDFSGNGFQKVDGGFAGLKVITDDSGLLVETPLRVYEGIRIRVQKDGLFYERFVPRDEYFGCVIMKLPEFIFLDTEFTDYIFPFLFASIPLIIFFT